MKIVEMLQTVGDRAVGGQYKVEDQVADELIKDGKAKPVAAPKRQEHKGESISTPKKK
jgi:hypothetical protein